MKTEKLVKTIKCDQCGKEVSDNGDKYFGSSPFHDWIHLNIHNGSSYVGEMNKKREFDFCSMECLHKYSAKELDKEIMVSPINKIKIGSYEPKTKIYDGMFNEIDKNGNVVFFTSKVY